MPNTLSHYRVLAHLQSEMYRNLITRDHLDEQQGKVEFKDVKVNGKTFRGWVFNKDGIRYLFPDSITVKRQKPEPDAIIQVSLLDSVPFEVTGTQNKEVVHEKKVYTLVTQWKPMRFRPEARMSFKQMVDTLSDFQHSNNKHKKLVWLMGFTSMIDKAFFRICSPPSFGKTSVVNVFSNLVGSAGALTRPTVAKLEFRTMYKWLVIDEAVDIETGAWKDLEQFLLDVAADAPSIEKRSRGSKERLDVSKHSITIQYNDITDYNAKTEYFDKHSKAALRNRFPAFRVHGTMQDDFNAIVKVNIPKFVKDNLKTYTDILCTYQYYTTNKDNIEMKWDHSSLTRHMPERWEINVRRLLRVIDWYSESQAEFDCWVKVIQDSMQDYQDMLSWPRHWEKFCKRKTLADQEKAIEALKLIPTFSEKIDYLENVDTKKAVQDVTQW